MVWLADGEVVKTSPTAPAVPPPDLPTGPGSVAVVRARTRGEVREVALLGPHGTRVLVGRPIGRELQGLVRLGWQEVTRGELPRTPRRPVEEVLRLD